MTGDTPLSTQPQLEGYLVVKRPEWAFASYLQEMAAHAAGAGELQQYWSPIHGPDVNPSSYAGWDRAAIGRAISEKQRREWGEHRARLVRLGVEPEVLPERLESEFTPAEQKLLSLLGEDPMRGPPLPFFNPALILDLGAAQEVLSTTTPPSHHEIIRVTRVVTGCECVGDDVLGVEVGSWGGPMSLISDTMVYPRWHPPPAAALPALRRHAAALGRSMLFTDVDSARSFVGWYLDQPWGELADGEGWTISWVSRPPS